MTLKVIGSGSSGNCYILESDSEALIIEAGCKLLEVKKALQWQLSKVAGCIISHEHNDHAGFAKEYASAGIKILTLKEVIDAKGLVVRKEAHTIRSFAIAYIIGGFRVQPFKVQHDVPCAGFIISHEDMGKIVFFTDTYACRYRFKGVNYYMVEANYCDEKLEQNIESGKIPPMLRDRLLTSHMEISNTINFLQTSDLSKTDSIILIHLSGGNSKPEEFKDAVIKATGKPTYIATAGLDININSLPL